MGNTAAFVSRGVFAPCGDPRKVNWDWDQAWPFDEPGRSNRLRRAAWEDLESLGHDDNRVRVKGYDFGDGRVLVEVGGEVELFDWRAQRNLPEDVASGVSVFHMN